MNVIPTAAVNTIEVLRDGASASTAPTRSRA